MKLPKRSSRETHLFLLKRRLSQPNRYPFFMTCKKMPWRLHRQSLPIFCIPSKALPKATGHSPPERKYKRSLRISLQPYSPKLRASHSKKDFPIRSLDTFFRRRKRRLRGPERVSHKVHGIQPSFRGAARMQRRPARQQKVFSTDWEASLAMRLPPYLGTRSI